MHGTGAVSGFGLGSWWRFAEYEIAGGYIRPVPGAAIEEYDPWELYSSAQGSRGKTQPPYQSLLELDTYETLTPGDPMVPASERKRGLTPERRAEIIRWCESFGLLGTFLHRISRVPNWTADSARSAFYWREFDGTKGQEFVWSGGVWLDNYAAALSRPDQVQYRPFGRYFPTLSKDEFTTSGYPKPSTEEFWRIYAEPVDDFLKHVGQLVSAIQQAECAPTAFQRNRFEPRPELELLNSLASRVGPALELTDDGSFRQVWGSPSLLASLATMAIFDLGGSQRILRCETCERHFVTPAYQAKYCSDTCRSTAQKRRSRAKKKRAAQASKSKGESNG